MEKITNITQATKYVYNQLKELNPAIEQEDVYDTILEEVLESVEHTLSDQDMSFVESHSNKPEAIDDYLTKKIPDYQDLLDDIVVDMVSEEILGE